MAGETAALSPAEGELVDCYRNLIDILRRQGDELPPYARRNAIKAAAALWQVANGAGERPGQIYDVGA